MGNSARKGVHGGKAPYGFRSVREIIDGRDIVVRWEIEEAEAEIIREMARLNSEENLGFKAISDKLNERGMRRESRHWVPSSIQQILRTPVIKGLMVYGRSRKKIDPPHELIEVEGVFPPILSDEEWDTLQQRMDIRKGTPRGSVHKSNYLLSGIARCGHCGGPMTGKTGIFLQREGLPELPVRSCKKSQRRLRISQQPQRKTNRTCCVGLSWSVQ